MAERPSTPRVAPAYRLGVPLLAAGVLTAVLVPLFPPEEVPRGVFHPAVVAGISLAGQLWYVAQSLEVTGPRGAVLSDIFGLANAVTLVRGGLYAVVAAFVVVPPDTALVWVPALCYGTGALLDRLDGVLARTIGDETPLGTRLDMAFDTFGFVAAPLVAVLWGRLPVWYLAISAARYVFLVGLYWRRRNGRPVYDLPDGTLSKYLAGLQMAFLTVALAPPVPTGVVWALAPVALAPSLAVFGRDFLVASGRLPRDRQD